MTKNNIIIAALRLFLLRGYKYVSLIDVANEAKITKGAIYHYFASKEELLNETIECLFDHLTEKLILMFSDEKDLHEILNELIIEQVVEKYIDDVFNIKQETFQDNHVKFMLEVMNHFPHMQKRIERDMMKTCAAIDIRLQKAMHDGEIRTELDINALTTILFSILQGPRMIAVRYKDLNTRTQIVENICKLLGMQHTV